MTAGGSESANRRTPRPAPGILKALRDLPPPSTLAGLGPLPGRRKTTGDAKPDEAKTEGATAPSAATTSDPAHGDASPPAAAPAVDAAPPADAAPASFAKSPSAGMSAGLSADLSKDQDTPASARGEPRSADARPLTQTPVTSEIIMRGGEAIAVPVGSRPGSAPVEAAADPRDRRTAAAKGMPLDNSLERTPPVAIRAIERRDAAPSPAPPTEVDSGNVQSFFKSEEGSTLGDDSGDNVGAGVPAQINRFTVLKLLGSGGMGEVYAAYDPELDRRVALKVLRAQVSRSSSSSTARARLLREAKALAKLSHPNVVAIYDVGTVDDQIYIAMEFVKGMTLTKWMRQAPEPLADGTQPKYRPWADVLALFLQAGRGLAAAHKAGIIHRDFKPDNVLIGRDGRVRVVDFGLARADAGHNERPDTFADAIKSLASQTSSVFELRLTRTDGMAGTPAYMAPEQYLNLQVDARTDQFSFCVALYEGLYGERPFRGDTVARVRKAVINGEIADAPKDADVPQWLRTILIRGLSVHPGARYPSMDALLAELSDDPGRPQQSWLRAGLIIVAGLAIAGIGFLELRDKNEGHLLDAEACAAAVAHIDEAYGPARQSELEELLTASSLGDTNQTWRRVDDILREMTADLKETARSICVLDQFVGDTREPFVELQRACLTRRRGSLVAFADGLRDLTPDNLANAIPAAHALLGLTPCSDPSILQIRTDEPDDPKLAEVSARLRRDLDRARVQAWLGDLDEALRAAGQVTNEAEHADNLAVRAEAHLLQGEIEELRGNYDNAERRLKDALWNAEASRHDEVAIDSLTALVRILGVHLQRHDEAEHLTPRLTAAVRRLGDSRRDARAHHSLGRATAAQGHTEAAILRLQNAAKTAATISGAYGRLVGAAIDTDLGRALAAAGRFDDAVDAHQRAVDALEATMGTNHPAVAQATVALCETWTAKDEIPLALRTCRRALELRGDPSVPRRLRGEARFALAKATFAAKRAEEAITSARQAAEEVDGDPAAGALAKQIQTWLRTRAR